MRLDAIVLHSELVWLGTEEEKVAFFGLMAPSLPRERLPHITVGSGSSQRVRFFPEDQPIAVTSTGRVVFAYVVSAGYLEEFRAFVQRHADLLRALPGWTVKVLVPRPLADAMKSFVATALRASVKRSDLRWKCQPTPCWSTIEMHVTKQNDSVFRSWVRCAFWRTHHSMVSQISSSRLLACGRRTSAPATSCFSSCWTTRHAPANPNDKPTLRHSILRERWRSSSLPSVGTPARWKTRAGDPAWVGASRA